MAPWLLRKFKRNYIRASYYAWSMFDTWCTMLGIQSHYSYFLLRDRISTCDVDLYWKIVLEERRINGVVVSCGLVLYHFEC